jgi:hypothetical protein
MAAGTAIILARNRRVEVAKLWLNDKAGGENEMTNKTRNMIKWSLEGGPQTRRSGAI